jgi:micrococcal nuclease
MRKLFRNPLIAAIMTAILIFLALSLNDGSIDSYFVERVIDGDTILVSRDGEYSTVRLIGIDAPESVHPDKSLNTPEGLVAYEYTRSMLEGRHIELETDVEEKDKYGRLLAYVWLDGLLFNARMVKDGFANVDIFYPNTKYASEILQSALD